MTAVEYTPAGACDADIIRANWSYLGFEYWYTDYSLEVWKNPANGQIARLEI